MRAATRTESELEGEEEGEGEGEGEGGWLGENRKTDSSEIGVVRNAEGAVEGDVDEENR